MFPCSRGGCTPLEGAGPPLESTPGPSFIPGSPGCVPRALLPSVSRSGHKGVLQPMPDCIPYCSTKNIQLMQNGAVQCGEDEFSHPMPFFLMLHRSARLCSGESERLAWQISVPPLGCRSLRGTVWGSSAWSGAPALVLVLLLLRKEEVARNRSLDRNANRTLGEGRLRYSNPCLGH